MVSDGDEDIVFPFTREMQLQQINVNKKSWFGYVRIPLYFLGFKVMD